MNTIFPLSYSLHEPNQFQLFSFFALARFFYLQIYRLLTSCSAKTDRTKKNSMPSCPFSGRRRSYKKIRKKKKERNFPAKFRQSKDWIIDEIERIIVLYSVEAINQAFDCQRLSNRAKDGRRKEREVITQCYAKGENSCVTRGKKGVDALYNGAHTKKSTEYLKRSMAPRPVKGRPGGLHLWLRLLHGLFAAYWLYNPVCYTESFSLFHYKPTFF